MNAVQAPESRTWESAGSESSLVKNKQFMEIAVETVRIPKIAGKLSGSSEIARPHTEQNYHVHSSREGRWMLLPWSLSAPFIIFISETKFVEERNASSLLALGFGQERGFIYALRSAYSKVV